MGRFVLAAAAAALLGTGGAAAAHDGGLAPARVVGYATWEHLDGYEAPGRSRTACGGYLNDHALTVAAHPRLGLDCGDRVRLCRSARGGCVVAVVNDRTGSVFTFELTYRLIRLMGAPAGRGWDGARTVYWRRIR